MTDSSSPYGPHAPGFDPYGSREPAAPADPAAAPGDDGAAWWAGQHAPTADGGYATAPVDAPSSPSAAAPASPPAPAPSTSPSTSSSSSSSHGNTDGDEDFDAWLAEHARAQPHVTLFGERVPIPFDTPLWITQLVEQGDADLDTLRTMIDALYGDGAAQRWIAAGAGEFALGTILAWTMLRTRGERVSFADAASRAEELAAEAEAQQAKQQAGNARLSAAAAAGGGDTPEARAEAAALDAIRDSGKASSSSIGAPSRPISGASTGSTAPGWRG